MGILCEVFLQEQALTTESLERLAAFGVDVGTQPHRDRSLPPRRVLSLAMNPIFFFTNPRVHRLVELC